MCATCKGTEGGGDAIYGIADVENLGYRSTPIKDRRCSKAIAEYHLANYYDQVKSWIADRKAQTKT